MSIYIYIFTGKWSRIESLDIPEDFFVTLLNDIPSAFVNTVREQRHLRPPVYREKATAITYRIFDIEEVQKALHRQSKVELQLKKTYLGDEVVLPLRLTGRAAIDAAKAQAHGKYVPLVLPSMEVQIVVGEGEGRATREFEMIWWPNMYSSNKHGKLVFRYYVAKVRL